MPVYKNGKIIAAVSVAIPLFRYDEANKEQLLQALQTATGKISRTIQETDAHFGEVF